MAIAWFFRPYSNEESYSNLDVERALKAIPAVDAVPVIHGRWGENGDCSECGFQPWYEHDIHTLSYCPNCGAKMGGESDG